MTAVTFSIDCAVTGARYVCKVLEKMSTQYFFAHLICLLLHTYINVIIFFSVCIRKLPAFSHFKHTFSSHKHSRALFLRTEALSSQNVKRYFDSFICQSIYLSKH